MRCRVSVWFCMSVCLKMIKNNNKKKVNNQSKLVKFVRLRKKASRLGMVIMWTLSEKTHCWVPRHHRPLFYQWINHRRKSNQRPLYNSPKKISKTIHAHTNHQKSGNGNGAGYRLGRPPRGPPRWENGFSVFKGGGVDLRFLQENMMGFKNK